MKQKIASLSFGLLCLFTGKNSVAQYNTASFYTRTYLAADGLPDSYTLKIFEDSRHYLWVGTYSGLSRFDGKTFTNYGINNKLPDLYVGSIIEDSQHKLWIGTRKGIGYLHNNSFIATPVSDKAEIDYVYNFAYVLKDKLWAFTSKGLYELEENKWNKKVTVKGFEDEPCRYAVEKNGAVYYCYPFHIIKVLPDGSHTIIAFDTASTPFFIQLSKKNEQLFVTTPHGLFEMKDDKFYPLFPRQLSEKAIYNFYVDSQKRFWVSTQEEGLLVSEPGNEKELSSKIDFPSNLISGLTEDSQGNMWIANYQGLVKIRPAFFDDVTPFKNKTITQYYTIAGDNKGRAYFYLNGKGLYYLENKSVKQQKFLFRNNILQDKASAGLIDAIVTDKGNNYWIASRERQLIKVTATGKQELIYPSGKTDTSSAVYQLAYNPLNRSLYICGHNLFIRNDSGTFVFRTRQNNLPLYNVVRALVLKNGNVLINSRTSGLWLIKPTGEAFELSGKMRLPIDTRTLFTEDNNSKVWLSFTGMGLQRYAWKNDSTLILETGVTTKNGLPNDVLEAMTIDHKNRLWAATLSGLIVMDTLAGTSGKKFIMYHVGKEQGLDFSVNTGLTRLMTDNKGDVWFCTNDHVIRFRTNELNISSSPPVTHIENIKLNMNETDWHQWSDSLEGYFMLPQKLKLPANQNTLTFTFKGINYSSDEEVWYSYKLVGVDTSWGPTTENNVLSLIKLTAGHFTFMVRARNNNSPWSSPTTFSFTIKPPFWKTWWFRAIGILFASFVLLLIFRTQLKRVNKKAALQNQLRNLEMKALKAQMNPHFVYNALNSIQSLVIDSRQQEALDYMVKFSRLLRQVLNHSEQNVVTLEKELATLELYIQLEALRLHYSLNYFINVDENIITEKEFIPPLILQPFVENALWHGLGDKEGDKNLFIHIYGNDHWIICRIEDNGVGRFANKQAKALSYREGPRGMEITINRLNTYNEDKSSDSITIEDNTHSDGSASGTTVTIHIRRK